MPDTWLGRLRSRIPLKLRKRRHIGHSRDVSWRIAQRDWRRTRRSASSAFSRCSGRQRHGLSSYVERLVPDRWCTRPQAAGLLQPSSGFKDHGLPDLEGRGWEEFLWRGEPFGFHVRSQPKLKARSRW